MPSRVSDSPSLGDSWKPSREGTRHEAQALLMVEQLLLSVAHGDSTAPGILMCISHLVFASRTWRQALITAATPTITAVMIMNCLGLRALRALTALTALRSLSRLGRRPEILPGHKDQCHSLGKGLAHVLPVLPWHKALGCGPKYRSANHDEELVPHARAYA